MGKRRGFAAPSGTIRQAAVLCAALLAGMVAGCASRAQPGYVFEHEEFDSTTTHSRVFAASGQQACEAARRALLSQGYMVDEAKADQVNGRKSLQSDRETNFQLDFRVACAPQGSRAIVFATALQDRYTLQKRSNSASLGVGGIGSFSLPLSSSDNALVKVASETISTELFYERFFMLLERYLIGDLPDTENKVVAKDVPRSRADAPD